MGDSTGFSTSYTWTPTPLRPLQETADPERGILSSPKMREHSPLQSKTLHLGAYACRAPVGPYRLQPPGVNSHMVLLYPWVSSVRAQVMGHHGSRGVLRPPW